MSLLWLGPLLLGWAGFDCPVPGTTQWAILWTPTGIRLDVAHELCVFVDLGDRDQQGAGTHCFPRDNLDHYRVGAYPLS